MSSMLSIKAVLTNLLYIHPGNIEWTVGSCVWCTYFIYFRAHVHPRVIQCDGADHEKFDSYEDALDSIKSRGLTEIEKNLKHPAEGNAISLPRGAYYAVAQGKSTGIFKDWQYESYLIRSNTSSSRRIAMQRGLLKGSRPPVINVSTLRRKQKSLLRTGKMLTLRYGEERSDKDWTMDGNRRIWM